MSSNLFKQIPFARVPLVRYSVASKRFNKAEVQLLKDFPSVGKKGQILKVSHSLMRNKLHPHNGACYIVPGQGPRIPIYKEPKKIIRVAPKPSKVGTPNAPAPKKISIDIEGLLLNIPKDNSKASSRIQPSKASYSLFNLSVNLGDLKFKVQEEDGSLKTPIDKSAIAAQIKKMVNISVPESDITLKIKRDVISEITKTGEYRLEIGTSEKAIKKIFVDAEL